MNVLEYIDQLPENRQTAILQLQNMVKNVLPNVRETMAYRMPTYDLEGHLLCALASQKNYLAFYLMPYDMLEPFESELKQYNCGKSCIRFKSVDESTLDLLNRILQYARDHHHESAFYGKYLAK